MGRRVRHAARIASAWAGELLLVPIAGAIAIYVLAFAVPDERTRAGLALEAAIVSLVVPAIWRRPRRRECEQLVGSAATVALESFPMVGREVSFALPNGLPTTLRNIAAAARTGELTQALPAGYPSRQVADSFDLIRKHFGAEIQHCLIGVPSIRADTRDVDDGFRASIVTLSTIGDEGNRLIAARGDAELQAAARRDIAAAFEKLAGALGLLLDAGESLERRGDRNAAAAAAKKRASDAAQIDVDRRCAHRATLQAARNLWTEADAQRRLEATWETRRSLLETAREHFTGVVNVEVKRMDHPTLLASRELQGHIADAIAGANKDSMDQLTRAVDKLAGDIETLEKIGIS